MQNGKPNLFDPDFDPEFDIDFDGRPDEPDAPPQAPGRGGYSQPGRNRRLPGQTPGPTPARQQPTAPPPAPRPTLWELADEEEPERPQSSPPPRPAALRSTPPPPRQAAHRAPTPVRQEAPAHEAVSDFTDVFDVQQPGAEPPPATKQTPAQRKKARREYDEAEAFAPPRREAEETAADGKQPRASGWFGGRKKARPAQEDVPPASVRNRRAPQNVFDPDFDDDPRDAYAAYDDEPEPSRKIPLISRLFRRKQDKEPPPRGKKLVFRILSWVFTLMVVGFAVVAIALVLFLANSTKNDDLWLDLDQVPYRTETVLLYTDAETGEVGTYAVLPSTQQKEYVAGESIPQQLRDAFVAVEDHKFYTHSGFDFKRTVYAALNEVKYAVTGSYIGGDSGRKQGASTINQQLVKNLTRDDEDSDLAGYLRKVREIYRAWKMDGDYDKNTILDAYLNTISFTGNTAGVQTEAKKLFGKTVDQLTLAECASLAAITRNPARFNPVTNPEDHLDRRNYVLAEMLDQGYITQSEHDEAAAAPLNLNENPEAWPQREITSYFTDAVIDEVIADLMDERGLSRKEATNLLYNGGLRIYTTVNPQLQGSMEQVMADANLYPRPAVTVQGPLVDGDGNAVLDADGNQMTGDLQELPQAAMISLDYDGGIAAVVGGLGEKEISRGFNRGTSAVRQVGSTMKPIAPYICAFEADKITWSTGFLDDVVKQVENEATGEMIDWPSNVDNHYTGSDLLVRDAFAHSVNTVAVRVGETVGVRSMYSFVTGDLGISTFTRDDRDLGPLVLGSSTYGITPLEMAKAYAMFGSGGRVPTAHSYTKITGGAGNTLVQKDTPAKQVVGEDSAYIVNRLMGEVLVNGTAAGMGVPGAMESVGKTGTTSDNRDHWFIGLTPYYVTASWYGYDSNVALSVNNAAHPPTLAWRAVMEQGQQGLPLKNFPAAEGVAQHQYCTVSGHSAGPNCPAATGWYKTGSPPQSGCPVHGG